MTISEGDDVLSVFTAIVAEPPALQEILDLTIARADALAAQAPGFVLAALHLDNSGTRLAEYAQWRTPDDYERFVADHGTTAHVERVGRLASSWRSETYRTEAVINSSAGSTATISVDADGPYTGVILLDCQEGKQRWVCEYNIAETHRVIRNLPGFVSASFFLGTDCRRIAEYVQWASPEHCHAAFQNPDFYEHIPVVHHYAEADAAFYRVAHVAVGPADNW